MSHTRANRPVLQSIILAAGNGSRLARTQRIPKPLMMLGERSLIEHALAHARAAGCVEAVVVVGHEGEKVKAAIDRLAPSLDVRVVSVPDASQPNGVSLLAAEPLAADEFFLQMVDHVFTTPVLEKLVRSPLAAGEAGRVLVDCLPDPKIDVEDATKVCLDGDRVVDIGKQIRVWDGIDAGCFLLTREVFDALRAVPAGTALTVSSAMRQLTARGSLGAVDIEDVLWADVDTPADAERAERLLLVEPLPTYSE